MCGILYLAVKDGNLSKQAQFITKALAAIEARGGHSWGYLAMDARGDVISEYKAIGSARMHRSMLKASSILVHTRYATTAPVKTCYTQPVRLTQSYGVHNGHISGQCAYTPESLDPLDSAHLLHALEQEDTATLGEMVGYGACVLVEDLFPTMPIAWADGGELHLGASKDLLIACSVPVAGARVKYFKHSGMGEQFLGWFDDSSAKWYKNKTVLELGADHRFETWGMYAGDK